VARSWRQNVIVSHGGRHGVNSRTFRKGRAVTQQAAQVIPDNVLGQVTGEPPKEQQPAAKPRAPEPGDRPVVRKLLDAAKPEDPKPKAEAPKAEKPKAPPPPPPPPVEEEPADIKDPTSITALRLLKRVEVEALAAKHDIEVEEGTKGRTQMLRDLLATKLNL
jgi:hypothetical protein